MPNGRAVAETLQIGDVVGDVVISVTEEIVDAYAAAVGDFSLENQAGEKTTVGTASAFTTGEAEESEE